MRRAVVAALMLWLLSAPAHGGVLSGCSFVGDAVRKGSAVTGTVRLSNSLSGLETSVRASLQAYGRHQRLVGDSSTEFTAVPSGSHVDVPFRIRVGKLIRVRSVAITGCTIRVEGGPPN